MDVTSPPRIRCAELEPAVGNQEGCTQPARRNIGELGELVGAGGKQAVGAGVAPSR